MKQTKKITILHSNDLHGDFLAEQVDEKLVGGVSMLSGYIEKVRAEQPNTIYVIAGDMFRGSVIDSEYKGLSTIEIMNALAPDVVTIGNHEVDYGIAHLLFIEKCARFPIINANLYIKNTPHTAVHPLQDPADGRHEHPVHRHHHAGRDQPDQVRIAGGVLCGSTAAAAAEVGKICNAHNSIDIDFTVLLTHIGFEVGPPSGAPAGPGVGSGSDHRRAQPHPAGARGGGKRRGHCAGGHRHRPDRAL